MPAGSILVNTARGSLIDEKALIKAISSGHISGVGLDCYKVQNIKIFLCFPI